MKRTVLGPVAMSLLITSQIAHTYDRDTHADMSGAALLASKINTDPGLLENLGLEPLTKKQRFSNSINAQQTIEELIANGSRFEDGLNANGIDECDTRSKHHFYDPIYERGLQWGLARGETSPDWALEDNGAHGDQQYSLRDARGYLYRALIALTEEERSRNFGLTFQTLGHVIHLQDMAQPEHTRNDIHVTVHDSCAWWKKIIGKPFLDPSLYESWTNLNRDKLPYTGYDRVVFPTAREYWTTGDERGIADFTNRNFLSKDTKGKVIHHLQDMAQPEHVRNDVVCVSKVRSLRQERLRRYCDGDQHGLRRLA